MKCIDFQDVYFIRQFKKDFFPNKDRQKIN